MKTLLRLSSFVTGLLLVLTFAAGIFGPSQAYAATAPAAQSGVQQQVTALLKRVPGSKQIDWNTVSLDNGKTTVTFSAKISASGPSNCRSGWFCLWFNTGYSGAEVQSSSYRCDSSSALWLPKYFNNYVGLGSYINYSPYTLKIYNAYDSSIDYESPNHWSSDTSSNVDVYDYADSVEAC